MTSVVGTVRKKWDLDDIIAPEKRGECEDCVCGVCLGIWNDPVQLKSCHHIFCKSCVLNVSNPVAVCPVCREAVPANGFEALQTSNKHALRRLNNLPVLCPFHKRKPASPTAVPGRVAEGQEDSEPPMTRRRVDSGSEPGPSSAEQCTWTGSFADLNKHLATCEWCVVPCPHGCGEEIRRPQLEGHLSSCPLNLHECEICHEKVKPSGVAEHERSAAEQHVKILQKECKDQRQLLQQEQKLRDFLTNKLEAVQSLIGAAHVTHAVWIVKDMATIRQLHPKGSRLTSPSFRLGPIGDLRMSFYPNGQYGTHEDGHYALYVCVKSQSSWHLELTLKVEEKIRMLEHTFTVTAPEDSRGWLCYGKTGDLPAAGDLKVFVELRRASFVVTQP